MKVDKIGLGGGCHWCTEAVFTNLKGVLEVKQGYIASEGVNDSFSEGILVTYDADIVSLQYLIRIHLKTHAATSNHSFRSKYRSAVYYFDQECKIDIEAILREEQCSFQKPLVTSVLPFIKFDPSREAIQDYYRKNPDAPFCKRYIEPKLAVVEAETKKG